MEMKIVLFVFFLCWLSCSNWRRYANTQKPHRISASEVAVALPALNFYIQRK